MFISSLLISIKECFQPLATFTLKHRTIYYELLEEWSCPFAAVCSPLWLVKFSEKCTRERPFHRQPIGLAWEVILARSTFQWAGWKCLRKPRISKIDLMHWKSADFLNFQGFTLVFWQKVCRIWPEFAQNA